MPGANIGCQGSDAQIKKKVRKKYTQKRKKKKKEEKNSLCTHLFTSPLNVLICLASVKYNLV